MTQEELSRNLSPIARSTASYSFELRYTTDSAPCNDYGQNGVELKNNIKRYWWDSMVKLHENIVGIDAAIFMHPKTWEASGHVSGVQRPADR